MSSEISIEDFKKVKMVVGTIVSAEKVKGSEKLLKLQVSLGNNIVKQSVAGLGPYYSPEQLIGKQYVFVTNLKPAVLMGQVSEVMILAAIEDKNKISLICPDSKISDGATVT
ncbi:MAG: methionine--tRNA ligase [Crenarchaeota archaeon]|nr:methionine--tRNA ligase [Thermoproteota archaeon]MDW8034003.1 methionine--tRNA ligase [Nitrososphaerota archaeon]